MKSQEVGYRCSLPLWKLRLRIRISVVFHWPNSCDLLILFSEWLPCASYTRVICINLILIVVLWVNVVFLIL